MITRSIKRSSLRNLLEFSKGFLDLVGEGSAVDGVHLDFQKAFEKVPHCRLSEAVDCEVVGHITNWICDGKPRVDPI